MPFYLEQRVFRGSGIYTKVARRATIKIMVWPRTHHTCLHTTGARNLFSQYPWLYERHDLVVSSVTIPSQSPGSRQLFSLDRVNIIIYFCVKEDADRLLAESESVATRFRLLSLIQSVVRSQFIESISGVTLPRSTGSCTRYVPLTHARPCDWIPVS